MPPQQQQMAHHPPPINTGAYPQGHPALGGAAQPPGYGGGYQSQGMVAPQPTLGQYGGRGQGQAVEVEGAGRSKAQLIVGIDFVSISSTIDFLRLLTLEGNYLLRRSICVCDQYRSKRRYYHGMARRWQPD